MGVIFKNNVMYGAGDIEISPVCYSEEEREIGCWTDGKPLYQKTIIIDSVPSNNWDYYDIADNIDKVVDYRGNIFRSDGGAESIEYNRYDSGNETWYTCIVIQNDNKKFFIRSYVAKSGMAYITFQYTKTTDTPGSGIWTPSGVPAVHYSTDEQIIGTWIDGSPLYQLTINVPNFNANQYDERISKSYYAYLDIATYIPNPSHVFCDITKSYITLQDSTIRTPIYADWQDGTSIAIFFPYVARTGTLTLTMQYTKSSS